ncbi:MAG: hypothetical protein ACKOPN_07075, partial [Prochlorococcaceae cyanobacterium]
DLAASSTSTEGMARAMAGAGAGARAVDATYAASRAVTDTTVTAGGALTLEANANLKLEAAASTSGGSRSLSGAIATNSGDVLTIDNHRLNEGDVLRLTTTAAGLSANTDYVARLVVFGGVNPTANTLAWGDRDGDGTPDLTLTNGSAIRLGLNSSGAIDAPATRYGLDLGSTYYVFNANATTFQLATTATGLDSLGNSTVVDLDPDAVGIDDPLIDIDRLQLSASAATDAPLVPITADASGLTLLRPSAAVALAGSRQDDAISLTAAAALQSDDQLAVVSGIDGNATGLRSLTAGAGASLSVLADGLLSALARNTAGDATAAAGAAATGLRDMAISSGAEASLLASAELQATADASTTGSPLAASTDPVLDDAVANLNLAATGLLASDSIHDISIAAAGDLRALAAIDGAARASGVTANSQALAAVEATGLHGADTGLTITIGSRGAVDVDASVGRLSAPLLVEAIAAGAGDAAALAGVDVGGILGSFDGVGVAYTQLAAGGADSVLDVNSSSLLDLSALAVAGAATANLTDASGGSSDVIGIRNVDLQLGAGLSRLDVTAIGRADLDATTVTDGAAANAVTSAAGILGTGSVPLAISFADSGRIAAIASQTTFATSMSVQGTASTTLSDRSRGLEVVSIDVGDSLMSSVSARSQVSGRALSVHGTASS